MDSRNYYTLCVYQSSNGKTMRMLCSHSKQFNSLEQADDAAKYVAHNISLYGELHGKGWLLGNGESVSIQELKNEERFYYASVIIDSEQTYFAVTVEKHTYYF